MKQGSVTPRMGLCPVPGLSACCPSTITQSSFSPAERTHGDYCATGSPSPPLTEKRGIWTRHWPASQLDQPALCSSQPHMQFCLSLQLL